MDTPDNINNNGSRIQSNPSILSKFEDSPVFNYISTLSPIKQFSVNHNAQSFHLLSFTSPQSLQTPPSINGLKESNIASVNNASDASLNNSSENDNKERNADVSDSVESVQPCDLQNEARNKSDLGREVYVTKPVEPPELVKLPIVKYECVSPGSKVACSGAASVDCEFNIVGTEAFPEKVIHDDSEIEQTSPENLIDMQRIEVEHNKEMCDWDKFISEASDLFNAHSPTKESHYDDHPHDTNDDSVTLSFIGDFLQTPKENIDDSKKMGSLSSLNDSSGKHDEAAKPDKTCQVSSLSACSVDSKDVVYHAETQVDDKEVQTTSRRCLIYELPGSHYRKVLSDSVGGSSLSNSTTRPNTSNSKCSVASKSGNSKFSSVLPGIGLHLNALAAAGRENKIIVRRENLTCRRQLISAPCTMSSIDSLNSVTENPNPPLASEDIETACEVQQDDNYLKENACENSSFGEGIGLPETSPKKKRKKQDDTEDINSCKRCNCKKSKCLKLYCECFAAGLYCVEPCNCQDCFNKPSHEDIVLETRQQIESRNPLAFAPKVVMCSATPKSLSELNRTPASARHKRGCNCKKSGCLKKYCECFQGGVGCSLSCRCEACRNTFGRKEGDGFLFEKAIILQKSAGVVSSHDEVSKADHEDQATPQPSYNERQLVKLPYHFDGPAPEQPLLSCTSQKTDGSTHASMLEKHDDLAQDDEASEFPTGDYMFPPANVKSTSPNCKRISSDHHKVETSLGWKSCRKLILRSIPSFSASKQEYTEVADLPNNTTPLSSMGRSDHSL